MMRSLYECIVRWHPPAFRRRFAGEMLAIFDEAGGRDSSDLVLDGIFSLARQWLLRTDSWKFCLALCGGFVQVFGFGMPMKGHQYWTENQQPLTPSMQQILLFALSLVCTLFVAITWMTLWSAHFQRRRYRDRRRYLAGFSTARPLARSQGCG